MIRGPRRHVIAQVHAEFNDTEADCVVESGDNHASADNNPDLILRAFRLYSRPQTLTATITSANNCVSGHQDGSLLPFTTRVPVRQRKQQTSSSVRLTCLQPG